MTSPTMDDYSDLIIELRERWEIDDAPVSKKVNRILARSKRAADALSALQAENERLRGALQTIATNDEYSTDNDGNPMPIRPQWSREQCSSIARQALKDSPNG